MKAIELTSPSLDLFRAANLDQPQPRQGEALVRMKAASLNFLDFAVATGQYPGPTFPLVPVADGAGEVVAIGPEVDTVAPGDRVAIHPKARWTAGKATARNARPMRGVNLTGSLREYAVVSADTLVKVPPHLSWEQAASLPITATTAWNALTAADIRPGRTVAVLGTGGASVFAIQLAKARGATVIVTSSSDEKLARAKQIGADHLINYRAKPQWDEEILSITDGEGVDLVLETAGTDTFARSLNAVRHGGTVFTIGFLSGTKIELDLMPLISKSIRVQGNNTGSAEDLKEAVAAISACALEPVIDTIFGVDDVRGAYQTMLPGKSHFGKLAIRLDF
jgi:2-desacetyl-2-hydroxyethyl bacteriochlorophyllide A dehydrogenase